MRILISIIRERCPFCYRGKVFRPKRSWWSAPVMHDNCPHCGKDFNGEPGYFFGAMYLSYGLAVALDIAVFLLCWFVLGIETPEVLIAAIAAATLLSSYKNFKWSRILWLKIFPPGGGTNFFGGGDLKK